MHTNIGRNSACPCGSGKKYKHCHIGKTPESEPTGEFPFPTVDEGFALASLRAVSSPFRAAYDEERPKITTDLRWTNKLPMSQQIVAQAIRLPHSATSVVYLRRVPAESSDAFQIAHELLHLVLDAEGFPFLAVASEQTALTALLNSLVQDPIINRRLHQYNFEIEKKIQHDLAVALASVQRAVPPHDRFTQQVWALNNACLLLECRIASSPQVRTLRETFETWFHTHHPAIAAEAEELCAQAQTLSYDTPAGMRAFFAWAVQRYRLIAQTGS